MKSPAMNCCASPASVHRASELPRFSTPGNTTRPVGDQRDQLVDLLRQKPSNSGLQRLIQQVEHEQPADLTTSAGLLRGVWELHWSNSQQPWLKPIARLENLQILNPEQGGGCNLVQLHGPISALGGIRAQAELKFASSKRVMVCFRQGG